MDEEEQASLIEQMQRDAAHARVYSKVLLSVCGLFVALLYLSFAVSQALFPWQSMHQERFSRLLHQHSVVAADLAGAAMAVLDIHACLLHPHGSWRSRLLASAFLAVVQTLFWSMAIYKLAKAEQVLVRPLLLFFLFSRFTCQSSPP